jgi:hypothetical protein
LEPISVATAIPGEAENAAIALEPARIPTSTHPSQNVSNVQGQAYAEHVKVAEKRGKCLRRTNVTLYRISSRESSSASALGERIDIFVLIAASQGADYGNRRNLLASTKVEARMKKLIGASTIFIGIMAAAGCSRQDADRARSDSREAQEKAQRQLEEAKDKLRHELKRADDQTREDLDKARDQVRQALSQSERDAEHARDKLRQREKDQRDKNDQ